MPLTLLTGGVRSGKSETAVQMAAKHGGRVVFVATATAGDDDMVARIERHRARRPSDWMLIEEPVDLTARLLGAPLDACVVIDCLTLWVNNLMLQGALDADIEHLAGVAAAAAAAREETTIAVTNEVGSGVHAETALGRRFADVLGRVNVSWSAAADTAYLVVAGRTVPLP